MCKLSIKLLSLALLFSLASLSVFGQAGKSPSPSEPPSVSSSVKPSQMTDAEIIAELMSNLEKREAILKQDKETLEREKKILQDDKNLFEKRKQLLTETENYWKNYKADTLKDKIIAGAVGFALGFAGGNYTGFKIGVSLRL